MTQTRDLIKKMADFFTGEEFYEKGEDARLELSPNDVRCMNEVIKACGNAISRQAVLNALYALCDTGETLNENPWRDNPHIDAVIETIEELPPVTSQSKHEDIAKAFQFGMAFGFIDGLANKPQESEDKE